MKIAILTSSFPDSPGHYHGNFIFYQARGQVELGHEVHVICPHKPGLPFSETMDGVIVHRFPYFLPYSLERLTSDSGMVSALSHSVLAWIQVPFFLLSQWYHTDRVIRRYSIDLVHAHWIIPQGLAAMICSKTRNLPFVITSHVADVQVFSSGLLPRPLLKILLSGADVVTTNSTFTKNEIEILIKIPCPCKVIPMGVYIPKDAGKPVPEPDAPVILFVGRLIPWKGVDILIRAMTLVIRKEPYVRLVIVGEGPERMSLEYLVKQLGIENNVIFTGRIDDRSLSNQYSHASVLVLPSRKSRGMVMEGLGMVLLEAMSRNIPVIGTNVGGIPDIIDDGKNGFLVPPDDEKALAEKILQIVSNPDLIGRFRDAGFDTIKTRFSWAEISKKFSAVYSQAGDR